MTTKSADSYRGLLWQRHADFLVLREAAVLTERGVKLREPAALVGELMIYRSNIEFIQVLPGGEL